MSKQTKRRVTIKDVAELANVAPSTVSFVLNNAKGQSISDETKMRVLHCVQQLGYHRNHSASSIRSGSAKTIGLVTSYRIHSLNFLDLINGVMEEASQGGYGVLICPDQREDEKAHTVIQYYLEGRIDGVVFISSAHSEEKSRECDFISLFQKHSVPFSIVYGYTNFPGICYANTDFFSDGKKATQLLIQKGAKRIAYIGALDKDNASLYMPQTERDRLSGYTAAIEEAGIPRIVSHFPRDFHALSYTSLIDQVKEMRADGFVCCWATYGLQLLSLLYQAGYSVPGDARIIALDSLPYLDYTTPPLSAIRLPFREMAKSGADMLMQQLHNPEYTPEKRHYGGILEMRASLG